MTALPDLVVPARFCGPPSSGNGGWSAGALAAYVTSDAVRVSLRRPPPLDLPMPVTVDSGTATATQDGEVVAVAEPADRPRPVSPVPLGLARSVRRPDVRHAFPTCFGCGPDRAEGDGLRILPGPVPDDPGGRWAAAWTPAGDHASTPVAWAAVDCTGGWAGGFDGRTLVLASITAVVDSLPRPGVEHVVVGEPRRQEGRKSWTAASLYGSDGRLVASAEHLWIALLPEPVE